MRKRIKTSFLLLLISGVTFFSSSLYWAYRDRSLKIAMDKKTSERDYLKDRIHDLKEKISLDRVALKYEKDILERLEEAGERLYLSSELNIFVASFENIREKYRGVSRASYEVRNKENEVTINISFTESYENLRRFIYELESSFYFLNISYLKIQKEGGLVRGNMGINVYFRGDKNR